MARVTENKNVSNFSQGWINKFNAISGSGNIRDLDNVRTQDDGTLRRRQGIEKEASATEIVTAVTAGTVMPIAHLWTGSDEDEDATVGMVVNNAGGVRAYSITTADMTANARYTSTGPTFTSVASYQDTVILGGGAYLDHDGTDPLNQSTTLNLLVRDFWGWTSTVGLEEHDTTATNPPDDLEYNLYNQGWTHTNIHAYQADGANTSSEWPALNQIMFVGKDSSDDFSYGQLIKTRFGSTQPASGRFIISQSNRDGYREDEVDDKEPSNAVGAFESDAGGVGSAKHIAVNFGGRIVYAGGTNAGTRTATTPANAEMVMITRVLQNKQELAHCYQQADPTSETDSQLIEDDGVVLQLTGCGEVFAAEESNGSMLFLCQNGVWQVSGADGTYFTATSFRVNKIYNEGTNVATPFKNVDGKIFFVNSAGIHTVEMSEVNGLFAGQNLNNSLLGDYKLGLADTDLEYIRMGYDTDKKELHIGFIEAGVTTHRKIVDSLVFNFNHSSVYKFSYSIDDTDNDYDALVDYLYVPGQGFKYLLLHDYKDWKTDGGFLTFYFGAETNADFEDLDRGSNSNDAAAYVEWWPETLERTDVQKESPFIYTQLKRSETGFTVVSGDATFIAPGGALLSYRWDWKTAWTTAKNIYITLLGETPVSTGDYDFPYDVNFYRSRVRGWGKALEVRIESVAGKDMHILGYNLKFFGKQGD